MGIASLTGGREEVKKDVVGVQHWTSCSWWPAHYRIIDNNHVYIYILMILLILFFSACLFRCIDLQPFWLAKSMGSLWLFES